MTLQTERIITQLFCKMGCLDSFAHRVGRSFHCWAWRRPTSSTSLSPPDNHVLTFLHCAKLVAGYMAEVTSINVAVTLRAGVMKSFLVVTLVYELTAELLIKMHSHFSPAGFLDLERRPALIHIRRSWEQSLWGACLWNNQSCLSTQLRSSIPGAPWLQSKLELTEFESSIR